MKYTILINQKEAIKLGLSIQEAILLDILSTAATWAEPIQIAEQQYYWVARQKILKELPILNIKPDTLYRKLKSLNKKGLIEYRKKGKKDCFQVTNIGQLYLKKRKSEKKSNEIGKKFKKNLEKNPTNKTTKNNTITTSHSREPFTLFKKRIIKQYSGKIVLYGIYVGYQPNVTFSLNSMGFLKNDFNDTVLAMKTHQDLIYKIWEFMYLHPHLIGLCEAKDLL